MTVARKRFHLLVRRAGLPSLLLGGSVALVSSGWLWHWDQLIYDWQLRLWPQPVPTEIVIVAIDEPSIAAMGSWP